MHKSNRLIGLAIAQVVAGVGSAAAAELAPGALPSGGSVITGQAAISSSGARMEVTQSSRHAIIDWQAFDIGRDALVNFAQPDAAAVILNRVSGPTVSRIEGQLTANGQVFLVNPSGLLFGAGARVNAAALVASSLDIGNEDFLAGRYAFSGGGGAIENHGTITAAPGGYLAFIAPTITNHGTISAPQGTVALGAGERVTLNFAGDRLLGLSVSAATLDTLIDNHQAIRASGGAILLTAAGAEAVTRGVINHSGVLEASSLSTDGGRVVLSAGDDLNLGSASTIAADGMHGGGIRLQARSGTLLAAGQVSARGTAGTGGTVELLGDRVGLVDEARVDTSGGSSGGVVRVGGDYQGGNPLVQNATRTFVSEGAAIVADAGQDGDGGTVIVWADEATQMYGAISARGGASSGNGGFVEASGLHWLDFQGRADLRASKGRSGTLLLDPTDITISGAASTRSSAFGGGVFANPTTTPSNLNVTTLTEQLALGNVTVSTASGLAGAGDIVVNNAINYASANSLALSANRSITIVAGSGGISNAGAGAVTLSGGGAGSIAINESITTAGGAIALGSGTGGVTLAAAKAIDAGAGTIAINGGGGAVNLGAGDLRTSNATASAASISNATTLSLGNVTLAGGGTLSLSHSGAGSQAANSFIGGTGGLIKAGTGTLTLSRVNSYLGTTTVNGGRLALSGGSAIADTGALVLADVAGVTLDLTASETIGSLSGGGTVGGNVTKSNAGAATLTVGRNGDSSTFGGVIQNGSGTVGLVKEGAGSLALTNANTYTGATAVSGGTLLFNGATGSATGSNFTVNSGARLLLDNGTANNDNRIAGTLTLNGGEFAVTGNATANTVESLGALSLTTGYSTVTLTPDVGRNTRVTFASLARSAGASALFRGTNLGADAVAAQTAGSSNIVFTAAPTLTGGGGNSGTATVSILAGAIGGGGVSGHASDGTDFLSYNPPTGSVNGLRPLLASEYAATPAANVNLKLTSDRTADDTFTINSLLLSGGVRYDHDATGGANTVTITSGNLLSMGGANSIQPTLATGTVAFGGTDAKLFTLSDLTLGSNAAVTGTGILGKSGSGALLANRNVARTGGIVVNSGTLRHGINGAFASQAYTARAAGAVDLNGFNQSVSSLTLESGSTSGARVTTGSGTLTLGGNLTLNVNGTGATGATVDGNLAMSASRTFAINNGTAANDLAIAAVLSGAGGISKTGAGTLALYGANTYTGTTRIQNNGGTLSVNTLANGGVASSVGASTNAAANLVLGANSTLQYVGGSASSNRNYTLTAGQTSTLSVTDPTANLTMAGMSTATTGALTKLGAGTLTLSGANLHTGLTTVGGGTLSAGADNALATGGLRVTSGATFDIGAFSDSVGQVTLINGTITGTTGVLSGSGTTAYAVENGTISAILAGTGGLTKTTAGTVALTRDNAYTGATTINAGVLRVSSLANGGAASNIGASTNAAGNLVLGGGMLQYSGATSATDRNYSLTAGTTSSINIVDFSSELTLAGASSATTGALAKLGAGTLTLTGANANTGTTTIRAGTLQLGNGGVTGSLGNGAVVNLGTLVLNRSNALTLANVVSSFGELVQRGSGTTTLTGANTYTGATTIDAGTLRLGAANRIADASALTVASGATFSLANFAETVGSIAGAGAITLGSATLTSGGNHASTTFSGTISGTGGVTKAGNGTLTLSGANTHAGATLVNAGTLVAANNAALGTTAVGSTVAVGATLNIANVALGAESISLNGAGVAGVGALTGTGTASVTGGVAVTGPSTIATTDAGSSLTLGGVVSAPPTLTIVGPGTLTATQAGNNFGTVTVTGADTVRLRDANNITLNASTVSGSLSVQAGGAITVAGALAAAGSGDAIVLAGGRFINGAGASALAAPNGRWLVWSGNPDPFGGATPDARNALAFDFKQYGAVFGVTPVAQGSGNGFLYSLAPSVTAGLTGSSNRVYDGTTNALLIAGNFTTTGAVDGDDLVLAWSGAEFADKHVGTGKSVTATGLTVSASNASAPVYGYTLAANTVSANIGEVTPAQLTVTAQSDSRGYDGTTASSVAPLLNNVIYDAVGTAATQSYDSRNAGTGKCLTASGLVMDDGNGGANYAISYVDDTTGVITPAALTVTAQSDSRGYDGSTASSVAPLLSSAIYDAVGTAATQRFDNRNAGTGKRLTASGLAMDDGNGGANYAISYVDDTTGVITPAALTVTAQSDSRGYDGSTASSVAPVLSSAIYDEVGTAATQRFDNRNAGTGKRLLASGLVMDDGNGGANYAISYVDDTTGVITPAPLSIVADNSERAEGLPNPLFTAAYVGLVGGDTSASLGGTLDFSTPATIDSPAGSYLITPFGRSSTNYSIVYVDGLLTVTAGPDLPEATTRAGFDPQAVAARYSSAAPPSLRIPAVQYLADKTPASDDEPASTVRVLSGGLDIGVDPPRE